MLEPLLRTRGRLGLKNFDPCTILLNDDLSAGLPPVLEHLHEQYLLPPLHAGWTVRRKSRHFQSYEEVAKKFAKLLGMDPWLINPLHAQCGQVDFGTPGGRDCVRANAESLLAKVRRKYKEYGINEKAFVMVKSDRGTGGLGLMTVRDVKDLDDRRAAGTPCHARRPGRAADLTEVIIQEGVPTYERIGDAVAEPVVCMIDRYVVGGFYRTHAEPRLRREPQRPRRGLRAAGLRREHPTAAPGRQARRQRAQPLLHVRRDRPPGDAGGRLRTRGHRPRRRELRIGVVARWRPAASACEPPGPLQAASSGVNSGSCRVRGR